MTRASAYTGPIATIKPVAMTISEALKAWEMDMQRRSVKARSVNRMSGIVRACAETAGWVTVEQVSHQSVVEYLAGKRTAPEGGKPAWSGTTHDQAVSALRCFGKAVMRSGALPLNPLEHLETSGDQGGEGARAATTEEVRALILTQMKSITLPKTKVNRAMFTMFLCLTGLRHDEAGSCTWGDLDMTGEPIALYSDPKWAKNKRRMRVCIAPELVEALSLHRKCVPDAPSDPVFPRVPNRHTWHEDREAAGIRRTDGRGRAFTYHSCRKWLATTLDGLGTPPGVTAKILRHANGITQERYIDPSPESELIAVTRLPRLLGANGKDFWALAIDKHGKARYVLPASQVANGVQVTEAPAQSVRNTGPVGSALDSPLAWVTNTGPVFPADSAQTIQHGNGHCSTLVPDFRAQPDLACATPGRDAPGGFSDSAQSEPPPPRPLGVHLTGLGGVQTSAGRSSSLIEGNPTDAAKAPSGDAPPSASALASGSALPPSCADCVGASFDTTGVDPNHRPASGLGQAMTSRVGGEAGSATDADPALLLRHRAGMVAVDAASLAAYTDGPSERERMTRTRIFAAVAILSTIAASVIDARPRSNGHRYAAWGCGETTPEETLVCIREFYVQLTSVE